MKQKSRSTTNNDLKSLKRFFRDFLSRPGVVESFRFPQSPFRPKVVLSKNELQLAYKTIDSNIGRALFLFYASTGLRRSEVLGLTVDEVARAREMGSLGVSDRYIDAFCGRTPKSVLARHYTDYSPNKLKEIYDRAGLTVLS